MDLVSIPIEWRLVLALFVMVAPTALFLGLLRGLERMRDGLVATGVVDRETERTYATASVLGTLSGSVSSFTERSRNPRCPACGGRELADTGHCEGCLAPVSSD